MIWTGFSCVDVITSMQRVKSLTDKQS